ncbi:major facilitator superfamily domain-containing protein 6-like [Hydractinia symbiolongicarpus]|uniref:major facilitator superfamily domain-containing protein 6-like n=1 Tax=Hydractinia symbiolongicarpus TaxID=13093 RepID=UPI0025516666|nr:major facilitator superfamily domain-containing protein 6-like [Hydractinia symbiolongicarpus]
MMDESTSKQTRSCVGPHFIKELIPAKLAYIGMYGTMGCVLPYFNAFLVSVGLTVTQSGLITGLRTIASLIGAPFIAIIIDHSDHKRFIVPSMLIIHIAVTFPVPWIAKSIIGDDEDLASDEKSKLFYVMLTMASLIAVFGLSIVGFIDANVMVLVKKYKNKTTFGYQRVFGPVGFAASSFLAGFVSDQYQIEGMSKYTAAFIMYLPFIILLFISFIFLTRSSESAGRTMFKLKSQTISTERDGKNQYTKNIELPSTVSIKDESTNDIKSVKENKSEQNRSVGRSTINTCRQHKVMFFITIMAHMGINYSLINGFQAIFMEKELGTTKTIIGVASALSPVSEILAFPVSAKLIKLFGGIYPSFIIATFSYCLRFLSMSFVEEPYLMVPIQLFQFFGFAIFWAAAVEYTNKISPIKISVTMFTIVTSVYYSLGNIVGNIVGGVIYDEYGGRWLFRVSSINCGFMTGLIVLYFFLYEKRSKEQIEGVYVNKHGREEDTVGRKE